jgi:hypothetical protein
MLQVEVNAWSAYWKRFSGGSSSKDELDRLMDVAARASDAVRKHIAECSICRIEKK